MASRREGAFRRERGGERPCRLGLGAGLALNPRLAHWLPAGRDAQTSLKASGSSERPRHPPIKETAQAQCCPTWCFQLITHLEIILWEEFSAS